MANSILSSLSASPSFYVKNSSTGLNALTNVKVRRVNLGFSAMIPRHMLENGTTVSDVRVINPRTLSVELIAPTIDDVEDIIDLMNDRETLYTIFSKGIVLNNMIAAESSLKQNDKNLSSSPIQILFKEILQETANPVICSQPGDSDNQNAGLQILEDAGQTVSSFFSDLSTKVFGD